MTEQADFLKMAVKALAGSDSLSEKADNSEYYSDTFEKRSREELARAQALALLSLATDVRRLADALTSVVESEPSKVICPAVRVWGSGI